MNLFKILFEVSDTQRGIKGLAAFGLLVLLLAGIVSAFFCASLWLIQVNWQLAVGVLALTFRKGYRILT